jgi:Concanavalin A-like lectin/glucanases superfamily/PEP-CTERM motif
MSWKHLGTLAAAIALATPAVNTARAQTIAYWNFETGVPGQPVPHSTPDGIFDGTTPDVSGSNNPLSVWNVGGAGFAYRSDVPVIGQVNGTPSTRSIKNTGGAPSAFSIDRNGNPAPPTPLNTATFGQFTVEASFKPENGGFRTLVGRDARNVATSNAALAALYLQARPDNSVGLLFVDVAGFVHQAFSPAGLIHGFDFATDPEGLTGTWYNLAAVSNGSVLSMYVNNTLVATEDMIAGGSPNRALVAGTDVDPTDDWTSGGWSVGRGLFNGGHVDRAYGFIDDIRISSVALNPSQFLSAVPEPSSLALLAGAAGLAAVWKRRARSKG